MSHQVVDPKPIDVTADNDGGVRHWLRLRYVALAMCVPTLLLLWGAARRDWYPTGDLAHTELMLRSIPNHPPLVGVAARVGTIEDPGSAPGPAMAYLLFPLYAILGRSSFGMVAAVNAVHLVAALLATALVWKRHGRLAGLIVALTTSLMIRSAMPDFFLEPWNVWIPVFAFLLYLAVLWGIAANRSAGLPLAVVLGAFCAQTHVSYIPLVAGTLAIAMVWIFANRSKMSGRLGGDLLLSFLLGALSLVPPVIEQFRDGTGNLARLWRHFSNPPEETIGVGAALKGFAGEYNLLGPWVTGGEHLPTDSPNLVGFVAMVALVISGLVVAIQRKDRVALELYGVVGAVTAVGLIAITRIFGEFYDYVIRWIWPINAISLAAALFAWARAATRSEGRDALPSYSLLNTVGAADLGRLWGRPTPKPAMQAAPTEVRHNDRYKHIAAVFMSATMAVLLLGALGAVGSTPRNDSDSRLVAGLSEQLVIKLPSDSRYLLRWHDPAALGGGAYGLVLELEREGYRVGVDQWGRAAAQPHRVFPEDSVGSVLWYVTGDVSIKSFSTVPGATLLATFDPRSPDERERSAAARTELERRFTELGRADLITRLDEQYGTTQIRFFEDLPDDLLDLVEEYNDLRVPGAVFQVPPNWGLFTPS